jgi:hypothetical protein
MTCIYCTSKNCIKKGKNNTIQKFFCKACNRYFQENSQEKIIAKEKYLDEYVFHKQTYSELNELFGLSKTQSQRMLDKLILQPKIHNPRPISLVVDATYFGKRNTDGLWGVLVFKDNITKEILWWKFIEGRETSTDYFEGKKELISLDMKFYP